MGPVHRVQRLEVRPQFPAVTPEPDPRQIGAQIQLVTVPHTDPLPRRAVPRPARTRGPRSMIATPAPRTNPYSPAPAPRTPRRVPTRGSAPSHAVLGVSRQLQPLVEPQPSQM
ncbi:hypothetical protein GCM10010302_57260 [Streptomyces polychromogenes]|uniref:Uncharacterized protein n=1 Tax=Streptomyces polychromogenes TaxID=67342 RepID=A0ABN0VM22_9ACTN